MLSTLKQWNGQLGDGEQLADNIQKLSPHDISKGIENYYKDMRLGIRRSGSNLHQGKGWNSHGTVTCHSYGCAFNMGADPKVEFL